MRKITVVLVCILFISVSCINDFFNDDQETLSVSSTFPYSDSYNIDHDISIVVSFDKPVYQNSISSNTFILKNGDTVVSGTFSYSDDNFEVIFKPEDGSSLGDDYTFQFETGSLDIVSDLTNYYSFSGNLLDVSGNNNHATGVGGIFVTDRFSNSNEAYYLDNHEDYIEIPRLFNVRDSEWSYSVWFKLSKLPSQKEDVFLLTRKNLDYSSDIYLYVDDDDDVIKVAIYDGHDKMSSGVSVVLDNWYFASVTYSEDQISLFVNGEFTISSSKRFVDNLSSSEPFNLSSQYHDSWGDDPASTGSVIGTVDDIRIYTRCLNKKEIKLLFDQESESKKRSIKLVEVKTQAEIQNASPNNWP